MSAHWAAAVGSGGLVGFTLGLVGGGGSILATPLLLYVVGVTQPHVAIGTGAVAVSFNAYAGLIGHAKQGHVWWRCAGLFALVGAAGALVGSSLGKAMNGQHLLLGFGILMIVIAALMLRHRNSADTRERHADWRICTRTGAVAIAAGAASGFFGIGGGFLIVPGLILATGMSTIDAVGSSLLAVGTFGLTTAVVYACSGLVDWPLAAEFIAGGLLGGIFGTRAATRLSATKQVLNRVFAILVFAVAGYVIYRSSANM